jgi:hypothetical protein
MPDEDQYIPIYTTYDDLVRLYSTNKLTVTIGDGDDFDLTENDARLFIRDAERWLTAQLSKRYALPLTITAGSVTADTLATLALYRAAYQLWLSVAGVQYQAEGIPQAVVEWHKMTDPDKGMVADIISGVIPLDGLATRITVRRPLYETRAHLYDEVRGESKTVKDDEVGTSTDTELNDGDILDGTGE